MDAAEPPRTAAGGSTGGEMQARTSWALTRARRHPVAMWLKGAARDVRWRLKGRVVENPPVPGRVDSVLFVCLGNICRSPFAGRLAGQRRLGSTDSLIVSRSAGIRTKQAGRSPREACDAAAEYDIALDDHRPVPLTPELVGAHDLIVVMEAQQLLDLRATYPDAADRIVLLPLFDTTAAGFARYNIEDPFLRPFPAYQECYRRIDRAVTALWSAIAGSRGGR